MARLFGASRKKVLVDVVCPDCSKQFKVEYEPKMGGGFYHAITVEGKKVLGMSAVSLKDSRSLKCPYCESTFMNKGDW